MRNWTDPSRSLDYLSRLLYTTLSNTSELLGMFWKCEISTSAFLKQKGPRVESHGGNTCSLREHWSCDLQHQPSSRSV